MALVLGGIVLGLVAYDVQIDNLGAGTTTNRAAAGVVAAWAFLAAGIAVWSRRPGNWLGPLMVATCFALLARQLRYSHDALAFTIFFALGELGFALIAHSALAYPSGRVTDRSERRFLAAAYAAVLAFPLAILLVHDEGVRLRYFDAYPRRSLLRISGAGRARRLSRGFLRGPRLRGPGRDVRRPRRAEAEAGHAAGALGPRPRPRRRRGRRALGRLQQRGRVLHAAARLRRTQRLLVADRRADRAPGRAFLRADPVPPRPRGRRRPRPQARAHAAGRDPRRARRGSARSHARGRLLVARTRHVRRRRGAAHRASSGRARPCGHLPRARRRAARGTDPRSDASLRAGADRRGCRSCTSSRSRMPGCRPSCRPSSPR